MSWFTAALRWFRIGVDVADDAVGGNPDRIAGDAARSTDIGDGSTVQDTTNAAAARAGTAAGAAANRASHQADKH